MGATDVTPDRSTPPAGGLIQIRIVDWAQRAERWVFMTNNTNPTQGASGIPLEPLHFDTFGSTRTWDPVPALVFDRWWTLPEDERDQRFEVAFKLLMDDAHSLDHDRHVALANAEPCRQRGWLREGIDLVSYVAWQHGVVFARMLVENGETQVDLDEWDRLTLESIERAFFGD